MTRLESAKRRLLAAILLDPKGREHDGRPIALSIYRVRWGRAEGWLYVRGESSWEWHPLDIYGAPVRSAASKVARARPFAIGPVRLSALAILSVVSIAFLSALPFAEDAATIFVSLGVGGGGLLSSIFAARRERIRSFSGEPEIPLTDGCMSAHERLEILAEAAP